jgi:hypothetical protein
MTTELQHGADATAPTATPRSGIFPRVGSPGDAGENGTLPSAPVRLARIAGVLYLVVVAVFGGFAQVVRVNVYQPGNARATTANIVANATLVRPSFVTARTSHTSAWIKSATSRVTYPD